MGVDPSPLPGSPCDGRMHGSRRVEFAVMRLLGRILAGLAILVVLLLIGVVVAATALGRETLVPPVAARIKALTGREFTVNGTARVALALPPRVELTDIALGNAPWASSPKMIEAKELGLTVEILPLLSGRFELSRIALLAPRIALETDAAGRGNWQFDGVASLPAPGAAAGAPGLPAALVIGNVEVRDAVVTWRARPGAPVTTVSARELALRTRALSGDVDLRFAGTVGDVTLDIEGRMGPLRDLIARQWPYPVDIGGTVAGQKLRLATKVRAEGARYAFEDLVLTVGANAMRGSLAVDTGGARPHLQFDLAAPALALAALPVVAVAPAPKPAPAAPGPKPAPAATAAAAAPAAPADRPARAWLIPDTPVSLAPLRLADADGKLAIERLTLPDGRETGALRASIQLVDGKLDVTDLSAGLFGGTLVGSITVDAHDPAAASIATRLDGRAMSLAAILAAAGHPREVRGGRIDLVANLAMRGSSPRAWASSANGTLRAVASSATITNPKVGSLLVWDKLGDAINPFRSRDASTELVCAVANLPLVNGVARVDRSLAMETSKVGVSASGVLDFRNETLDLVFAPKVRKGISIDFAGLSDVVRLTGPFASPRVAVDAAASAKVIASLGAAIGTGGWSAAGQALLSWSDGKGPGPCQIALDGPRAAAGSASAAAGTAGHANPAAPVIESVGKAIGKLFGR